MPKKFADTMNDAQVMMTALKTNLETLKKRGLTEEFVSRFESSIQSITAKNSEQERLKADLHAATVALNAELLQLEAQMKESITVVKLEIPKEHWREFGIVAKR